MILDFIQSQITNNSGVYYSPEFIQDGKDEFITVTVWLAASGTVTMQVSIDGVDWFDLPDSSFSCNLSGLQTYNECQYSLLYRIKADKSIIKAKILI